MAELLQERPFHWARPQPQSDREAYANEADEENASGKQARKPWRYRWIDEDRDEVLTRLLELNRLRAEEEAQSAPAAPAAKTAGKRGRKSGKIAPAASPSLFEIQEPAE